MSRKPVMTRRIRRHDEHTNHEAWAIPYGDLVTLLLAFFVVMYAISSVNAGKYRVLSDSLFAAFRGTPRTMEPIQVGEQSSGSGSEVDSAVIQAQLAFLSEYTCSIRTCRFNQAINSALTKS